MNTVVHTELHNIWEGRVIVDEIRQFKDDRGMLVELWRTDDEKGNIVPPKMSYWSLTNALVLRGPHEHSSQVDEFISWFNRMVYQLYNPETGEMFHFVTDPTKIYRITVGIGIIHSYRNLELRPITTGNFPTSLFMGENKKSPIDEIRHEEKIGDDLDTYVVIGAGGRLGKALVDNLYKNMGYHKYHVIPIYEKLNSEDDVIKLMSELIKVNPHNKIKIINCAALTNVQKLLTYTMDVHWTNVALPRILAEQSSINNCKFYQISTDYVYRENDESVYTQSKKEMESYLKNTDAVIIQVANLFSLDPLDTHNIISKLKEKAKLNQKITVDPNQLVYPTDVSILSSAIINFINNNNSTKKVAIHGKPLLVDQLYSMLGGTNICIEKSTIKHNSSSFLEKSIVLDCDKSILLKNI